MFALETTRRIDAKINRGDVESSVVPFSSREINAPRDVEVRDTGCELFPLCATYMPDR